MNEGDIVFAALPQAKGQLKPRPVLLLRAMPPPWRLAGLKAAPLIRLGFLSVLPGRLAVD